MKPAEILESIRRLPPEEQSDLLELIMIEFGDLMEADAPELTPELIAELDRRAEEALLHPERCRPMEEVFRETERKYGFRKRASDSSARSKTKMNSRRPRRKLK